MRAALAEPGAFARAAAGAKAFVADAALTVAHTAVQLHGGMGVVDELNVSHYFKRLTMIGLTFGDADYHLGRFLFECFPRGTGFPAGVPVEVPAGLPHADVRAISLDDATTTEIDDAFSITPLDEGRFRVGIHIAAPALGFAPGSSVDAIARARLSTVYFPGEKITMLPPEAITAFSLDEGTERPALSLYLDVRESDMGVENEHSAIEMVPIAANLRHQAIGELDQAFPEARVPEGIPFAAELYRLWRLSIALRPGLSRHYDQLASQRWSSNPPVPPR